MYDDFFGIEESEQYAFYRVPKLLFTSERFWNISTDAKMLYGLFLDRMALSQRNGWIDEQGQGKPNFIYVKKFTVIASNVDRPPERKEK